MQTDDDSQVFRERLGWLVIGLIGFGISLAVDEDFHSFWIRTVIVAAGGGILGYGFSRCRGGDDLE